MALTPSEQLSNISVKVIAHGKHTVSPSYSEVYEVAATFTVDKPMLVEVKAGYTNTVPTGVAVARNSATDLSQCFAKNEYVYVDDPAYKKNYSAIGVTTILPEAGTYKIYTRYHTEGENNWYVYGLEIT